MGVMAKESLLGYTDMKITRHIKDKDFVQTANHTTTYCAKSLGRGISFSLFEVQITFLLFTGNQAIRHA